MYAIVSNKYLQIYRSNNYQEYRMQATQQNKISTSISIGSKTILFAGIAFGILLLTIGAAIRNNPVTCAGTFILSIALFWGGLFNNEEQLAVKITLLALGGIVTVAGFLGMINFGGLF